MRSNLLLGVLSVLLVLGGCSTMGPSKSMAMAKDGVFLKDGKVMETMNGKTTDLMMDLTLKDGTKVMKDGTVMMKDGTTTMLHEGEMYDLDGMKSMIDKPMADKPMADDGMMKP